MPFPAPFSPLAWGSRGRTEFRNEVAETVMTPFEKLQDIAYNLRWDWHEGPRDLFHELDPVLWEQVRHNPVALLRRLDRARVDAIPGLEDRAEKLWQDLRAYLAAEDTWFTRNAPSGEADEPADRPLVAYFCAEYGLTECLRIYSGGLGVLAGDHLKSASDLGVPLVGVGLLYREGYFEQTLDPAGKQREAYPAADFQDLPLRSITGSGGQLLRVAIPFPGRTVMLRVWRADVGRVPLFLLDADLPENTIEDRALTSRLYGGAQEMRISQEILLGIGGYRALHAMGIAPRSFHMNEGHSAFLGLELLRNRIQDEGLRFEEAVETVRRQMVFTTHTPVPAGHDRFPAELLEEYFDVTAGGLGLDMDEFMSLGRIDPAAPDEPFTMTVLAIRLASQVNGVSELHGRVTREMWRNLWPDRVVEEVPVDHVTNGVHLPTWVHPQVARAFQVDPGELGLDSRLPHPDPARLWTIRNERRHRLLAYVRERVGARLDPHALTIAFARRFATYKRATLLLGDLDRLERLLRSEDHPVQVLFAGKAHPKDEGGQALIRRIVEISHDERFHDRIVFIPGYGIDVARELVQGADVWLNNPRRPMEASGTSGMKAAANGVLNLSVLDGWWDEAYSSAVEKAATIGWAIGEGVDADSAAAADRHDEAALFRLLEDEVVPLFYDRDPQGNPRQWAERVAASIQEVAPFFNTHRMLRQYVDRYHRATTQIAFPA
jgi:glycogen phosphorylase